MQSRERFYRAARYVWRAGWHPGPHAPGSDWAAWAVRMILILVLVCWSTPALLRPNIPLLFPSYMAFDDSVPFTWWGYGGASIALLLWLLPPRVPLGLISTSLAMVFLYLIGAMFQRGAGLLNGTALFQAFGALAGVLFGRALWLWAQRMTWFRVRIMREEQGPGPGGVPDGG